MSDERCQIPSDQPSTIRRRPPDRRGQLTAARPRTNCRQAVSRTQRVGCLWLRVGNKLYSHTGSDVIQRGRNRVPRDPYDLPCPKPLSTELTSSRGSPSACRVSLHVVSVAKRCKAAPISVVLLTHRLLHTYFCSVHDSRTLGACSRPAHAKSASVAQPNSRGAFTG